MRRKSPQRVTPGPNQESVWDYPRPPRLEPVTQRIRVVIAGETVADTTAGFRVLETSHPPTYYLPPADIRMDRFHPSKQRTLCEWKGHAAYLDYHHAGQLIHNIAWTYPQPLPAFANLRNFLAFYPSKLDAAFVDEMRAVAQPGDFYGGWITPNIVGPFKGPADTLGW